MSYTQLEPGMEATLLERTALKEWAVLVDAMVRGDFCAMIRKGGIREQRAGFSVRHNRFLMYPTFFHEKVGQLAESVREGLTYTHASQPPAGRILLSCYANVRAVWRVTDLDLLRELDGQHGLAWPAVEFRFHYKNKPGVHVVAVDLLKLPRPVNIPETKRYLGCVSWVELDEDISLASATPIRPAAETEARVLRLHQILGNPLSEELP